MFATTQGNNLRQDYLNQATQHQLADGIIDVFVDTEGTQRGVAVPIDSNDAWSILTGLHYFDQLTGIDINFVETEAESELSIHRLNEAPGMGFEQWNLDPRTKGIAHSKHLGDNNVYFEGGEGAYTSQVIYHELAHIFGAYELADPFSVTSTQTVMGYQHDGFVGYTGYDRAMFEGIYGSEPGTTSMTNQILVHQYI